jgi:rod shape determining protein RodA
MIFTVSYEEKGLNDLLSDLILNLNTIIGKQTLFIGISLVVLLVIFIIDKKFWSTFAYPIYVVSLLLLVGVLFLGVEIKGAKSWFYLGGFTFQPSELAKFGTSLAVASYLSAYNTNLKALKNQVITFGLFMIPVGLILLQPDAGSAMVFLSFLLVAYRAGLSSYFYITILSLAALLILGLIFDPIYVIVGMILFFSLVLILNLSKKIPLLLTFLVIAIAASIGIVKGFFLPVIISTGIFYLILSFVQYQKREGRFAGIMLGLLLAGSAFTFSANYAFNNFLEAHQKDRINVWLRPDLCDPQGSLYNVLQSKMAIGSGGLKGKGFLQGTMTKLNYVPEQSTDFIFCTIGEEQGFVGSLGIIALFFLLLIRIIIVGERQKSDFGKYYAYCVAGIIFIHFLVNIGMTMGLLPIIGIPLPFISYGGSSMVGFTLLIGVLLKIDSMRFSN